MKFKDYYRILGVARDASQDEIKKAYRRLARKFHPDVSKEAGAEEKIKEVNEAHDVLGDPEKRSAYDRLGSSWRAGQEFQPPPGWGAGGGFTGTDFSDLFNQMFSGRKSAGAKHSGFSSARAGRDVEATLELTLEEAFHGVEKHLSLAADGETREVKLRVPPGALPGKRLKVPGKGGASPFGGAAGHLYLTVEILPHPRYRLEGRDIYLDTPITPWEAVLGTSITAPTLSGNLRVRIPPGARNKLRLPGRGMPAKEGHGDFYVQLRVVTPPHPGEEELELYRRLAAASRFDPRPDFPKEG